MRKFLLGCLYTVWVVIFTKLAFGIPPNAAFVILAIGFMLSGLRHASTDR